MLTFQQVILALQDYWGAQGCALLQPYDMEVGAGTSHTATFLRALGPEPWRAAYVQPSRRPKDGRYGENPNRLHQHHQFQVVLKPSPANILDLYLGSLEALGFDLTANDVRFVEDDWENPTLGAWGLGWEVWLNGMEITQFTYFQQVGGLDCNPITGEITYGLERLLMYLQNVESVYDLAYTDGMTLRRRVPPERGRAVELRVRRSRTCRSCSSCSRCFEAEAKRLLEAQAAAAGLRDDPEGRPHVQPARRARRDLGHRARRLHRPHPRAVAARRGGVPRVARARWASRCCRRTSASACRRCTRRPKHERRPAGRRAVHRGAAAEGAATAGRGVRRRRSPRACASAACAAADATVTAVRDAAPARRVDHRRARRGAGRGRRAEADAAQGGEHDGTREGKASEALVRKLGALGRAALAAAFPTRATAPTTVRRHRRQGRLRVPASLAKGQSLAVALQDALDDAIARLPIPKVMSYAGAGGYFNDAKFVRPAHRLLALHGARRRAGARRSASPPDRTTGGHRFLAATGDRHRHAPTAYAPTLEAEGKVLPHFATRRGAIVDGAARSRPTAPRCSCPTRCSTR